MFETALHIGTEHPNLLWLFVAGMLCFGGGLAVGLVSRLRDRFSDTAAAPDGE
jgi:hypothetical protein